MSTKVQTRRRQQNQPAPEQQQIERTEDRMLFAPPVDIYETNDAIHVQADMPGVSKETLEITLEQDVLTLRGRTADDAPHAEQTNWREVWQEYRSGDYERQFRLPDNVDRSKVEAIMRHGVLHLTLPKAQPTRRKIEVKSE